MTGLLRYARRSDGTLRLNRAHGFAATHALVHYRSGAVYSFIPKNGCSTMRYSLARANMCIAGPEDWTWIHMNNDTFSATLSELVRAPYSFVILRCPHARLASVFLDKIVGRTPEMWHLHGLMRERFDPDRLSFRDFVGMIADDEDVLVSNIHWRPQADFLVYENYTRVFALERFGAAVQGLRADLDFEVHDARTLTGHGTDRVTLVETGDFADTPVAELADMRRAGRLPAHARLYDGALMRDVARLYSADLVLYAAHLDPALLSFPDMIAAISKEELSDDKA